MSSPPIHFCVFSYNRGRFLEHCVRSIQTCAPAAGITIFDDHSDDEATQHALERLRQSCAVVLPDYDDAPAHKCGGLYGNMQRAPADSLACFIQDDMQLVRPLDTEDYAGFERYFAADAGACFLQPAFMRDRQRARDECIARYDPAAGVYFRADSGQSAGVYFSAVSVLHVARLHAAGWEFEPTEKQNEAQARGRYSRLGLMRDPFMFYLPSVPAYRGKTKTWALRHAERMRRCGFYPYRLMSPQEVARLRTRDPATLPVAEDWLQTESGEPAPPWIFYPIEGSPLLKTLNSLELRLRRWWQRIRRAFA